MSGALCIRIRMKRDEMNPGMLYTGTGEAWLLSTLLLIGAGFILFGRGAEYVLIGMVVIGGVISIVYANHLHNVCERFLMEQFHEGRALECGMWIGESTRVDSLKGWSYEEEVGFVKGDVIINDVGVCSVIGRPFPEPSTVPYWMFFVSLIGILMILRAVIMGSREGEHEIRDE